MKRKLQQMTTWLNERARAFGLSIELAQARFYYKRRYTMSDNYAHMNRARELLKQFRQWFFASEGHAAAILMWPLLLYSFIHILWGNVTSGEAAWRVLGYQWNIGGIIIAVVVTLILLWIFLWHAKVSQTFERIAIRIAITLIVWTFAVPFLWEWMPSLDNTPLLRLTVIALISAGLMSSVYWIARAFSPQWRFHFGSKLFVIVAIALVPVLWQFRPPAEDAPPFIPQSVSSWVGKIGNAPSVPAAPPAVRPQVLPPSVVQSKHQPGFSGVENDGDITTAWVNGREEKGVQAAMLQPGEKYEVLWKEGAVSSFNPLTKMYDVMPLWGVKDGYIYKPVDWSPTFRYSGLNGIKPHATLVVLGEIGSGQEKVSAFPEGQYRLTVQNNTNAPQPLTLYYHAMAYYWLSQQDGVYYPSQALAASMGRPTVVWKNGWQDQGKTSAILTVKRLP